MQVNPSTEAWLELVQQNQALTGAILAGAQSIGGHCRCWAAEVSSVAALEAHLQRMSLLAARLKGNLMQLKQLEALALASPGLPS